MPLSETTELTLDEPDCSRLEDFISYKINILSNMLSRQGERYLKQNHGIAVPDYRILMTLVNLGEMSVREVAQHTKMDKALISRVVNRLVSNRLVRSMPDPDDGRLLLLTYTSAGLALYKELLPFVQNRQRDLLAALGDTDKREFVRSLDKLIHFLDASD